MNSGSDHQTPVDHPTDQVAGVDQQSREAMAPDLTTGLSERHKTILEMVREHGFITIEQLARHFSLTPQTIRRDINYLSRSGLLTRYHGGAGNVMSSVENLAYTARKSMCASEKRLIGELIASHIPNYASLFINIGTTTEAVARELLKHSGLRIITNNLNVAMMLSVKSDFEIIIAGGLVRNKDRGIIGEAAIDFIRQFKVDYGIIGISGVDMDGTLLDFDYREVRVARAIIENSRKVFLAADHTKFGRNAMVRLGRIDEIHTLFTDRRPPGEICDVIGVSGVELRVSEE